MPDKMAAFLDEMKSVRLRKTGRDLESSKSFSSGSSRQLSGGGSSSLSTSLSRVEEVSRVDSDVSFLTRSLVVPRSRNQVVPAPVGPRAGDKRKRRGTLDAVLQDPHGEFAISSCCSS